MDRQVILEAVKKWRENVKKRCAITLDWSFILEESQKEELEKEAARRRINVSRTIENGTFHTSSRYSGGWDAFGMTGRGRYRFPGGCEYDGGFEDGMFHGEGTLTYPMGQKLDTIFEKGKMIAYRFSNVDGLDYEDSWQYCTMPDRRFNVSIREGLQPPAREFMTNLQPERALEKGWYDTGDGVYDPKARCITLAKDSDSETENTEDDDDFWIRGLTMVPQERHDWILQNCRKGADDPAGYRPEFYEDWISGRRREVQELEKKYKDFKDEESNDVV